MLIAACAALSPAASATKYVDSYFGNPGSSTTASTGGLFNSPGGVAVHHATGNVYVVDRLKHRIQQFTATGNFIRTWGTDVIVNPVDPEPPPPNSNGTGFEVCDTQHPTTPNTTAHCKSGITSGTGTGGQLSTPEGVAVNQSSGHVYVTERGRLRVQEFTATGEFVRAWGRDVVVTGAPNNISTTAAEVCDTQHPTTPNTAADCKAGTSGAQGGALGAPSPSSAPFGHPAVVPQGAPNEGNVLVADAGNQRVQEFTSTGEFVRAFGSDVVQPGGEGEAFGPPVNEIQRVTLPGGFFGPLTGTFRLTFAGQTTDAIAADAPASAVDAALEALPNVGPGGVSVSGNDRGPYTVEFTGTLGLSDQPEMTGDNSNLDAGFGPGVFVSPITVATTQPGGPGPAFEICTDGPQCKAGATTATGIPGAFSTSDPGKVAADATGAIYTVESRSTASAGNFRVQKFTPQAGSPSLVPEVFAPDSLSSTSGTTTPLAVDVDPITGHVFVVKGFTGSERHVLELTPSGALLDTHLVGADVGNQFPDRAGLALRPSTGELYFSVTIAGGNARHGVFIADDDGATPAIATVNPAANVSSDGADLSGVVNPNSVDNDFAPTTWKLQYSRNGLDWSTASSGALAAGTTGVPVTGSATGLGPNTVYLARIVTQKPFANPEVASAESTFKTDTVPPEIRTTATQSVTPTSATVSARINPHGTQTSYRFEWGEQGSFSEVAPVPDGSVGSGPQFVLVTQQLTGLRPGATYQYRAIAMSASEGPTVGPTRTFTTPREAAAQGAGPSGRGFELVSPPDKVGGSGLGVWYGGPGSHGISGVPAYEGERYASAGYYGATLADGGFSYGADWTFGERTPAGWRNQPALNRQGGFGSSEFAKIALIETVSDDLSLTSWGANSQLRLFEEQAEEFGGEAAGNVLTGGSALREWSSGRWEIVAPVAADQQVSAPLPAVVAAEGGYALAAGRIRGVAGPGDPTHPAFRGNSSPDPTNDPSDDDPSDLVCPGEGTCNGSVYLDDVTAGLSDSFPGAGIRSLVNACTGVGAARTAIPSIDGTGEIVAAECPAVVAGRDARLIDPRGASLASNGTPAGHISGDGSRVFFMSPDHGQGANLAACTGSGATETRCPPQLYVRQRNEDGSVTTRWISQSAVAGLDTSLLAAAVFEGATPDGDKVFFRTASPLTADDPNGGETDPVPASDSVDLYMYDLPDGPDSDPATADADPAGGTLTRISAGPTGDSDANVSTDAVNAFRSSLRAVGGDGSPVYFTTAAPLAGVPDAAGGTITSPGGSATQTATKNLYAYDASRPLAQRWRFMAQLPASSPLGQCATKGPSPHRDGLLAGANGTGLGGTVQTDVTGANCVRATADGSFITLFTDGRLTADDPDSASGDVYAYDADADELTRLSAPQGGVGGSYVCVTETGSGAPTGTRCHGDPFISSIASRAPLNVVTDPADPRERTAFFESASRLVPEDHNDVYDVYQWRNGKLSLVSTGAAGADDALYRGNDRTGRNVYISTRDALTWQDHDRVLDVYTARVGGGIPRPDPPQQCSLLGGTCQGPPAVAPLGVDVRSTEPSGQNVVGSARMRLAVARPSRRALRRAARRGVLAVRVRSDGAGKVRVVAKARIGKRTRRIGRSSATFDGAGAKTVNLRLSRSARKRLSSRRRLRVRVTVDAPEARPRSLSVPLRRARR